MNSSQLKTNEYAPFYSQYVKLVGEVDLLSILQTSLIDLTETLENLDEEKFIYKYAEGKWTIKELVQHIIDAERIFCYRALRFSRNDTTSLSGYDEDWYVENSDANKRDYKEILLEFIHVRNSTISLFNSFSPAMLLKGSKADNNIMTVRAIGFIIAGHQMHHLKIIKEKYL